MPDDIPVNEGGPPEGTEAAAAGGDPAAAGPTGAPGEGGSTEGAVPDPADAPAGSGSSDAPGGADATAADPPGDGSSDAGGEAGAGESAEQGSKPSDDADLDAAAQVVEGDLAQLAAEREQFLEAYRRAQADFENYRKQAQKRQEEAVARQLGALVERLLPVLDACDAAAAQGAAQAVEPIVTALFGALEKEGLERVDPKGEPFDPAVAEAVVHEPGGGGAQVVADVLRTGYRWQGRLLRPALVKVTD
ncbi:MAG TPA: nucleotide exchange factor GrpE [Acidimicrobiales bacterium]